tara:strand:- start:5230 stop:5844 length:615 start_codon:yes stop_codon:yes gene_type:complete
MSVIDHKALAESRLATQFRESTNLINYIKALLVEANTLEAVLHSLLEDRWVDTAYGVQLDIIGSIVGQPRTLVDATTIQYFGFLGFVGAQSFGTVADPVIGGRFRSKNELTSGTRNLIDEEYRLFIKSRILANISSATINETIAVIISIFGDIPVTITEGTEAEVTIDFGTVLSLNTKTFLVNTDIIPLPVGVTVNYEDNSGPF